MAIAIIMIENYNILILKKTHESMTTRWSAERVDCGAMCSLPVVCGGESGARD